MGLAFGFGFAVLVVVVWGMGIGVGLEGDEHKWQHLRVLMAVVLVVVGGFFAMYTYSVHSATTVEGTVVASSFTEEDCDEYVCHYAVHLHYEYEYAGRTYKDSGVWYGDGGKSGVNSRAAARSWADEYHIDDAVTLIVNPNDPTQSGVRANFFKVYQWPLILGPALWFGLRGWTLRLGRVVSQAVRE